MLSPTTLAAYRRDGLIVLPDTLTPVEVEALRRVTDAFVSRNGGSCCSSTVPQTPGRCSASRTESKFDTLLLAGSPTLMPRLAPMPVRLPLPPAEYQGSIYENQRAAGRRFFETATERDGMASAAE
jgi:hypothetical protein